MLQHTKCVKYVWHCLLTFDFIFRNVPNMIHDQGVVRLQSIIYTCTNVIWTVDHIYLNAHETKFVALFSRVKYMI